MKGREVRERLRGRVDQSVIDVLAAIGESMSAQQQEITELAEIQNRAMDTILQLGATVEGATNAVDALKKQREG
jgi:hypothetical protein